MKFNKPKFWDTKFNLIAFILLPFALIVQLIVFFRKKFIKSKKFNIPIICIGNIYLGGTGKTPASIYIGNQLLELKKTQ
jgi:tetraacyldisaccharide 4'-kinase